MTRFARAKGSKASNARLPEESTSWQEMRSQMIESQQSKSKPYEVTKPTVKTDCLKSEWAVFEQPSKGFIDYKKGKRVKKVGKNESNENKTKLKSLKHSQSALESGYEGGFSNDRKPEMHKKHGKVKISENFQQIPFPVKNNTVERKKQKSSRIVEINKDIDNMHSGNVVLDSDVSPEKSKQKLKNKKKNKTPDNEEEDMSVKQYVQKLKNKKRKVNTTIEMSEKKGRGNVQKEKKIKWQGGKDSNEHEQTFKGKKMNYTDHEKDDMSVKQDVQKRKNKKQKVNTTIEVSEKKGTGNVQKERKRKWQGGNDSNEQEQTSKRKKMNYTNEAQKKKQKKTRLEKEQAGIPFARKKCEVTTTIYIEGREVEIRNFDGFPVKKEDWERLIELKKKMLAEGIPKDDIAAALKLERRRAEKALARERKKVCFYCRKPDHVLSECPDVGDAKALTPTGGTGVCFKCGSTEHSAFQCRVTRGDDFRYAQCFVCGEQGHISRQCPDNPRGLYPQGGGCRICGDVTHLRKDCPEELKEKQENTVTVETLDAGVGIEALGHRENKKRPRPHSSGQRKIIKFT